MPTRGSWRCGCGAYNPAVKDVCESCGAIRTAEAEPDATSARPACSVCHAVTGWTQLTRDEDGHLRCASCHLAVLHGRMAAPEERCEDGQTVAEKITEFRRIVTSEGWKQQFSTKRHEERG